MNSCNCHVHFSENSLNKYVLEEREMFLSRQAYSRGKLLKKE